MECVKNEAEMSGSQPDCSQVSSGISRSESVPVLNLKDVILFWIGQQEYCRSFGTEAAWSIA